jgi:hypothetical protein
VSRPEPPPPVDPRPSRPARPSRPTPPIAKGQSIVSLPDRPASRTFTTFLAHHPRLGGFIGFVLFGAIALHLVKRVEDGELLLRSWISSPIVMHAAAAVSFAGLWFLVAEVPVTERHTIPTWWKAGLGAAALLGGMLIKPIGGLLF